MKSVKYSHYNEFVFCICSQWAKSPKKQSVGALYLSVELTKITLYRRLFGRFCPLGFLLYLLFI